MRYVFKFFGVTFLYVLGFIVKVVKPYKKTYSFKAIWNMEFEKQDDVHMIFVESWSQHIIGMVVFTAFVVLLVNCIG